MALKRIPGVSQKEWDALPAPVLAELARIPELEARIARLEAFLTKNSTNSHKPPSTDGFGKTPRTQSERTRSGRRAGGQAGHPGKTLRKSNHPDERIRHPVNRCGDCGHDLSRRKPDQVDERQVFDLPPMKVICTAHEAEIKDCPHCGCRTQAPWPKWLAGETGQAIYGPGLRALGITLTQGQFIPYRRASDLMRDLFGQEISTGTLAAWTSLASERLIPIDTLVANALAESRGSVHFDETGAQVAGSRHWLHAASHERLTHFRVHAKRGVAAIEDIGILPRFRGVAIHDRWVPYFRYLDCRHGLCGAHLLRDLRFIWEEYGEKWARRMRKILKKMSAAVNEAKGQGRSRFYGKRLRRWERAYDRALKAGLEFHARMNRSHGELPSPGERGRKKKRDGKNLVDALQEHRTSVLRFLNDFTVPFTNNQGERDIRMTKVKLKVSGCFRSILGAVDFCRIRGYLSTARKQGWNLLEAMRSIFLGAPMQPLLQPP